VENHPDYNSISSLAVSESESVLVPTRSISKTFLSKGAVSTISLHTVSVSRICEKEGRK
jgi:hypothetical protein